MRFSKAILFLIAIVSAVALVSAVPTISGQDAGNKNRSSAAKQKQKDLPVVDFANAVNAPTSPQRQAKNKRYDLKSGNADPTKFALKESDPEELYELTPSHVPARSAIPATQSDAVIIGEVVGSEAFLSNDKTGVYSEFTLQVEEVLKNSSTQNVYSGASLTAERKGGAVRFPSGKVLRRGHLQETMPLVGGRYLFFLRSQDDTRSFSIITGYNLRDGRVYPLDGVNAPEGANKLPQFAAYDGVEEGTFLKEVRAALAAPASKQKLVRLVSASGVRVELQPNLLPVDDYYEPDPEPDPAPAPTPCTAPSASQDGKLGAWAQNAPVTVVIQTGTGQFTAAEVACLTKAFNNWNTANVASGNASGVRFNVTSSPTAVGTMNSNGSSPSTGGQDNVFQVSRGVPSNSLAAAITGGLGNSGSTARGNAVTLIHPEVGTDVSFGCEALTEVMAHEIGHTLGLGHCQSGTGTCNQNGTSVMNTLPCGVRNSEGVCTQPAYNDVSRGTPGPTTCDNNKAKEVGQYDPTKTNQPAPPSAGGGGGDGYTGGGYGDGCTHYYWVYYESWDGGETWEEVDRWYAGCW